MPGAAQTGRHGQEPGEGHPGSTLRGSAETCAHRKCPGWRDLSMGQHGTDPCTGLGMPQQGSPATRTLTAGMAGGPGCQDTPAVPLNQRQLEDELPK